jgi:hypothetical protein
VVLLAGVLLLDGGKEFGVGLFNEDVAVVHSGSLVDVEPCAVVTKTGAAQANG